MPGILERLFHLRERGTTVRTEVLGGATTFTTMAYIIVVNPAILYFAGLPVGPSTVATILTAVFGSLLMGVWLATSFTGGFLSGYIGSLWSRMPKPEFFLLVAGVAAIAGVMIWELRWVVTEVEDNK